MTKRRRAANPMFQTPLTKAEADPKAPSKEPKGRVIICALCGLVGGTLKKNPDNEDEYIHADEEKCKMLQLRR